jgi:two-component system chemotaxis sensor kinase CheA
MSVKKRAPGQESTAGQAVGGGKEPDILPPAAAMEESGSALVFKDDPEILADFVMESSEHLAAIDEQILMLERDPSLIQIVHGVFRAFHSIKGLAGFLGLTKVQSVAHEVETLLDHARELRTTVTPEFVDLVLDASEYLKEEVAVVQARLNQTEPPAVRDMSALLSTLSAANAQVAAGLGGAIAHAPESAPAVEAVADDFFPVAGEETVKVAEAPDAPEATTALLAPAGGAVPAAAPTVRQSSRSEVANTSIRVETSKLDRLMDMVGEMVIAQSMLNNLELHAPQDDARRASELAQLARITGEVQRCAMSMRMTPIGPLFQKNAKMVRDLARRKGKQVKLELKGEGTELDKTIAEELADPLLHMIRNALDHGIESAEERVATGKDAVALLRIKAEHQAGQIVISISDDGRGLHPKRIHKKALEKGIIDATMDLTEDEIFHLIFKPGFSTAEKITDISGRGVGMDVVRQHVETLRGRIEIKSEIGVGTTFFIYLPLTLAIIEGLVIAVGVHRYIIPLFSVREMFRPTAEMMFSVQGRDEMILMRGDLLPVVRLHRRFNIEPRTESICDGLIVVCEFSGKLFCLFVDELQGRQEVVIKSLDPAFQSIKGLSGSAILGDGRIGLILDVGGLFHGAPAAIPGVGAKESIAA